MSCHRKGSLKILRVLRVSVVNIAGASWIDLHLEDLPGRPHLGFAIGLAPAGAWVAVTGMLEPRILLLSLALMTYIAGFDILYSCQDIDFDSNEGLFSMPCRRGVHSALRISSGLHMLTFLSLFAVYFAFSLGPVYLSFLSVITLLLILEHKMVRPDYLDKVNIAFFHVNTVISVLLFMAVWMDFWLS